MPPKAERPPLDPAHFANDQTANRWAAVLRLLFLPEELPRLAPEENASEHSRSAAGSVILHPSSTTKGQMQ
jgi:hypothetical protein